jgi:hypothetical protein
MLPVSLDCPFLIGPSVYHLFSLLFFVVNQKYAKETRGPKLSKRVCPYICVYIIYSNMMSFIGSINNTMIKDQLVLMSSAFLVNYVTGKR